jgi:hypothetical protein
MGIGRERRENQLAGVDIGYQFESADLASVDNPSARLFC